MSYAVVYMPIKTTDGETILVTDLPVAEVSKTAADVFGEKAVALWPVFVAQAMTQVDTYAEQKLWPAIRAEVDRATSQAESRLSAASKQVTWLGLLAVAGIAGVGMYVYSWKR